MPRSRGAGTAIADLRENYPSPLAYSGKPDPIFFAASEVIIVNFDRQALSP
jgi:hypothetical protein